MGAVRNYSTKTIMEKKQTEERGVKALRYGIFRGIERIARRFFRC